MEGWNEAERIKALLSCDILDTPPERDYDQVVEVVRQMLHVPMAAITLVGRDRVWVKAEAGLGVSQAALGDTVCASAILKKSLFVVPDLRADPDFRDSRFVKGGIRFYAGAPLLTPEGLPLGLICALGDTPRDGITEAQANFLNTMAALLSSKLHLRRNLKETTAALDAHVEQQKRAKLVEARLREVTTRLELAVQTHAIGVFDTDVETGQVYWSEELEAIYGYAAGTFPCTVAAWRDHVLPEDLGTFDQQFVDAIAAGHAELSYVYRIRRCDGQVRFVEASARFFYDEKGRNVRRVGVNLDVTDRETTERRLAQTEADLIHLSRLNSLGAMASSLSHELNQPLTAIANYVAAARKLVTQDNLPEAAAVSEALDLASGAALRAGELIKRLRDLAKKKQVEREEVSLSPLIAETAALALHDAGESGIKFTSSVHPDGEMVLASPVLLQQVLFNLLRNAAEAMTAMAGTIQVRASAFSPGKVLVEIEDTGPGLAESVAANLFSAFVTTKSDGMGVGLSICRTIIENDGGRIWAESGDTGTTFSFTLSAPAGASAWETGSTGQDVAAAA